VVLKEETMGEMYKISRYVNDLSATLPYISMPTGPTQRKT
jgi:acetyl-CoA carboxylase beta subunit